MIEKLAKALLTRIYYPVTAVVAIGAEEEILDVMLFDSVFGTEDCIAVRNAKTIAVVCGHPDGRIAPTKEEIRNLKRITAACGCDVRAYLFGEDIGLLKVDRSVFLGYNEENDEKGGIPD